jgi:hypothetical protein
MSALAAREAMAQRGEEIDSPPQISSFLTGDKTGDLASPTLLTYITLLVAISDARLQK